MSKPDAQVLQEIKARLDLVEIVRRYVDLRQVSGRWVGPCPFHHETKPSFGVHPEQGFYYCFGCQASGDLFSFYGRINGLDFKETVTQLAAEAGVKLRETRTDPEEQKRRDLARLCQEMHDLASAHFRSNLRSIHGSPAREYISRRGLDPALVDQFGLGFSLEAWQDLADFLQSKGITAEQGVTAGLMSRNDRGRMYDRFRGRLMFPIQNLTGQVIAFGGRIIGEGDPKYLNSSDSPIYKKGDHLYGLHQARPTISRTKRAILTEGYMDVITLHQFGYGDSVGVLGTALTPEQIKRLSGFCTRIDLVFDGDEAGKKAALRSSEMLLSQGLDCRVVLLPAGEDIDSLLRKEGRESFEKLLADALEGLDFCLACVRGTHSAREILNWARGFMRGLKDPAWRAFYIPRVADGLGLAEAELRRALMEAKPGAKLTDGREPEPAARPAAAAQARSGSAKGAGGPGERHDRMLLDHAIRYQGRQDEIREMGLRDLLTSDWGRGLWDRLCSGTVGDYIAELDGEASRFVAECLNRPPLDDGDAAVEWEEFKDLIRRHHARSRVEKLTQAMREAQSRNQNDESLELLKANADITGREE